MSELIRLPISSSTDLLLDTNVAIDFLNAPHAAMSKIGPAARLFVPVTVLGELYFGAQNSTRVQENLARIDGFAAQVNVVHCDIGTARHYGAVWRTVIKAGNKIPYNDAWIAACAVQHGLPLVTRDAHFGAVPDVATVPW